MAILNDYTRIFYCNIQGYPGKMITIEPQIHQFNWVYYNLPS